MKNTDKFIYVACPWAPIGGGMFKVADYLIQSHAPADGRHYASLRPLDTRGSRSAAFSAFVTLVALLKLVVGRVSGRLVGVHVNMAERLSLFRKGSVILACRGLGIPVVLHLHAAQLHHFYRSLPKPLRSLTRGIFALSSHCVVLGHASKAFVTQELGMPPEKIDIVINGVPPPLVQRRARLEGDPYRVFFLGNLSERKGVSDLLHALAAMDFDRERLQMSFAGNGDIEGYKALAAKLGVSGFVHFVGWADQAKAGRLMAASDILVLPSYDEGLPLVILEALAHGVAVVCTPVGEIPTVLTDGIDACFVTPGDIPGIAAGLAKVLKDDGFRTRLEKNGKAIYQREFSLPRFFSNIADIHKKHFGVMARPAPQAIRSEVTAYDH